MKTITFEEKQASALDLPTLKETLTLAEFNGKLPSSRPLEHFQFIEMLQEKLEAKNYMHTLDPIYVRESETRKVNKLDPDKKGLAGSFVIQRLVTRLMLTGSFESKEYNSAIAIGFNERGLQVAFGVNVRICANMSIFGGKYYATYGGNEVKTPYENVLRLIDKSIEELPESSEKDIQFLTAMKDIQIPKTSVLETVGDLEIAAVNQIYGDKSSAPMNISQVSSFVQKILRKDPELLTGDKLISLYDFYNMGTELLHPTEVDAMNVWPQNAHWGSFIENRFLN